MEVNGAAFCRRQVPSYGRVYAPRDWRGHKIRVLVTDGQYTISVADEQVSVEVEPLYDRVTRLKEEGKGNPQLFVGRQHEDATVVLVRDPTT